MSEAEETQFLSLRDEVQVLVNRYSQTVLAGFSKCRKGDDEGVRRKLMEHREKFGTVFLPKFDDLSASGKPEMMAAFKEEFSAFICSSVGREYSK